MLRNFFATSYLFGQTASFFLQINAVKRNTRDPDWPNLVHHYYGSSLPLDHQQLYQGKIANFSQKTPRLDSQVGILTVRLVCLNIF